MTEKLQTNEIGPLRATTGDNIPLETTATVNWIIEDVRMAARMAASTMGLQQSPGHHFDMAKLQKDVLRQATASLAAFIGGVRYSTGAHVSTKVARTKPMEGDSVPNFSSAEQQQPKEPEPEAKDAATRLFDVGQLTTAVNHANEICLRFGVRILSINIITAYPSDTQLMEALTAGAVATASADQAETAAMGNARALAISVNAEADALRVRAEADADAERIRAKGTLEAAQKLEGSEIAKDLARIRSAGGCLGEGKANSFFFGLQGPSQLPSLLANPSLVQGNTTS